MPFSTTAIGIGALLGGAASGGSAIASGSMNRKNRKWQEKMYNLQVTQRREDAQAQYERMKDYASWAYSKFESPIAQRSAMQAAGINPFFQGSAIQSMGTPQGTVSQADGGSVPSQGPYQNNPMSNIMAGASSLREAALQGVQAENIQAQTEYTNAQRLKTIAETKGIENTNSLFDFVRSAAESDALSKKFAAKIKQVESEWAEIKAIQDAGERDARIAELWSREEKNLADAAKTDADRLTVETLRDGMKRLQDVNIENVEAQTKTEGEKQANLRAITDTTNESRQALIDKIVADTNSALADADLSTEKSRTEVYNRVVDALGLTLPRDAAEGAAREIVYGRRNNNPAYLKLSSAEVSAMLDKYKPGNSKK